MIKNRETKESVEPNSEANPAVAGKQSNPANPNESDSGNNPNPGITGNATSEPEKRSKRGVFVVGAVILAIAGVFGYRAWSFAQSHAQTDDAYVSTTTIQISPQVSGNIKEVLVDDNQFVKKGTLLVTLDDGQYVAAVDQAQANLDAAIAAAKQAGVSVTLTEQSGNADITQASGAVSQSDSAISSSESDVRRAEANTASVRANSSIAKAQITAAQASYDSSLSGLKRAQAGYAAAQAVVRSAEAQVNSATSLVVTARANAENADKEAVRYQNLVQQGAVSQSVADAKALAARTADSSLASAEQQVVAAQANLAQQQANAESAQEGITTAQNAIVQARANLSVARNAATASSAGVEAALAQQRESQIAVSAAKAKYQQALGQLQKAQTVGTQVSSQQVAQLQAEAKVEQARAALAQAKLNLSYTKIYAPIDGRVTNKTIDVGELMQPGLPMLSVVSSADPDVYANFKETQMPGIAPGQRVEIDVDAIPGYTFTGKVTSLQYGTGSAFTLLPPDNASGNFTKVVQRIPVKIEFDPNQPNLDRLATGMSTEVTVELKK